MKKVYLIILGDIGNKHYHNMLDRLKKAGLTTQLIDNVFILSIEAGNELDNMEQVRNYIAGQEYGYCLVITINSNLSCAWSLSEGKSELFARIIRNQRNEA